MCSPRGTHLPHWPLDPVRFSSRNLGSPPAPPPHSPHQNLEPTKTSTFSNDHPTWPMTVWGQQFMGGGGLPLHHLVMVVRLIKTHIPGKVVRYNPSPNSYVTLLFPTTLNLLSTAHVCLSRNIQPQGKVAFTDGLPRLTNGELLPKRTTNSFDLFQRQTASFLNIVFVADVTIIPYD